MDHIRSTSTSTASVLYSYTFNHFRASFYIRHFRTWDQPPTAEIGRIPVEPTEPTGLPKLPELPEPTEPTGLPELPEPPEPTGLTLPGTIVDWVEEVDGERPSPTGPPTAEIGRLP